MKGYAVKQEKQSHNEKPYYVLCNMISNTDEYLSS